MNMLLRKVFVFAVLLGIFVVPARASDSDPLPVDSAVVKKKLPNGLTYYIRANKKPENRAQFHLVVNAGSILETEKTQGIAHFLEHMAFNGTKNFEKNEIINFLERTGMQFGADLNAYTSFDETAYRLEVPMDKPDVVKRAMQVLEDWAHNITFDAKEIDKERGVVTEEWRSGRGAGRRLSDKQFPVLFHESLYAKRLPIGETNDIAKVSRSDFRDFYTRWYRPDLMAVIAVGDFDVKEVEKMIVEHFGRLKNPARAPKRPLPEVPDHEGTLFSIETDPELSSTTIQIVCKHPVSPDGSASDYRRDLVEGLYSSMLNQRIGERVMEANPPYLSAGVGKSHMVRAKDMATMAANVKEGQWAEGLKALLLESRRARRDGFTTNELERVKVATLRGLERAYAERDKTESSSYAREFSGNFLENEPIPGIEAEVKLAKRFFSEITLAEVNHAGDRWITETNRVILYSAPEKAGLRKPTKEEILAVIKESDAAEISAYDEGSLEAPLLTSMPKPGTIVSEKEHKEIETTEWVLSNGVHVLLKPTTFKNDAILMNAFSPGGHSLVSDADYLSAALSPSILSQSGWGPYDSIQLRKKLAGKIAAVGSSVGELFETVNGSASPKDLETWFQLVYLHFTAPRADEKSFQSFITRMKENIENRERNPAAVFGDEIEKAMYGNHPRHRPMTLALLKELDREKALQIYRDRFANAGDFTFVFVGAFKTGDLKPLVEKYLASLPATERKETWKDIGDDPKRGKIDVEVKKGLEPKASVRLNFYGDAKWSIEERYAVRAAIDVLRIRLREVMREDKGGVYGVGVGGDITRLPKATFSTVISFTCNPDNIADLTKAAMEEIKKLQTEGPSKENMEKVRETTLRNLERNLKEDGFWLSNISYYRENDLEFSGILKARDRAMALTPEKVKAAAQKYFSTENMLTARLLPEGPQNASNKK